MSSNDANESYNLKHLPLPFVLRYDKILLKLTTFLGGKHYLGCHITKFTLLAVGLTLKLKQLNMLGREIKISEGLINLINGSKNDHFKSYHDIFEENPLNRLNYFEMYSRAQVVEIANYTK